MRVFINSMGCISPQGEGFQQGTSPWLEKPLEYRSRMIQSPDPTMDTGLEDKYLRRMSRIMRLGWTAARICLDGAGDLRPDAIITGSGWGSVGDSEKFLLSIYRNKENFLPPTPFIQSTHNALAAQIAMLLESYHYNMSYAHISTAFEHALLDSLLRLRNDESQTILCGGFDEITDNQFILYDRLGWWRKEPEVNLELISRSSQGTICGEGYAFFILQKEMTEKTMAEVKWVETIHGEIAEHSPIIELLKQEKIDWVFAGLNGDLETDRIYRENLASFFPGGVNVAVYKHLCGEYLTASAFAMYLAALSLRMNRVPGILKHTLLNDDDGSGNILIYHHHKGKYHSFILLSKTE